MHRYDGIDHAGVCSDVPNLNNDHTNIGSDASFDGKYVGTWEQDLGRGQRLGCKRSKKRCIVQYVACPILDAGSSTIPDNFRFINIYVTFGRFSLNG